MPFSWSSAKSTLKWKVGFSHCTWKLESLDDCVTYVKALHWCLIQRCQDFMLLTEEYQSQPILDQLHRQNRCLIEQHERASGPFSWYCILPTEEHAPQQLHSCAFTTAQAHDLVWNPYSVSWKVDNHLNRCEDLNSQSSTCSTRDSED